MKQIHAFTGSALIAGVMIVTPALAQSAGQSTQSPPSGTQSGQTTGGRSGGAQSQPERDRDKKTSYGEKVGEDVPSQGTQTDQRGRTAARSGEGAGELRAPDRTFLLDALEGNKAEVELARLAGQKATSASVKELAQTLQQHHSEANTKLKAIASQARIADNDPGLKPQHKQLQDRLAKLEGAAFDQAYASEMVKEHQKDIDKYQKASTQLQHSALKAYATETLPTLKQHLEKARQAAGSRGTP